MKRQRWYNRLLHRAAAWLTSDFANDPHLHHNPKRGY